jgi:acyl-Coa thioesterase superfamily protein/acyl-CoA thioesterase superfamily protein
VSESIFVGDGDLFTPTEHARGPWDPRALHGGAPAALITAVFERIEPGAELPFAHLYFEFLRPVPMAPLKLNTRISRAGRRVQALEAELSAEGVTVCRASALRLVPTPEDLPQLALEQVEAACPRAIAPASDGEQVRFALDDMEHKSFAATAMEMRFLHGKPLVGGSPERDTPDKPDLLGHETADKQSSQQSAAGHVPSGAATVWMRLRHPLLPDEPLTSLARVAATSDFGNGVATVLPFEEYLFINADLTISLNRRPQGEWVALDARTLLHPGGIGWAESVLHDELGPVGRATQALVVQRR